MKKSDKIQIIYLAIYFIGLITLMALLLVFPNIYMILAFIVVLVFGWVGMYIVKSRLIKFKCNKCGNIFKPSVFKEIKNRLSHSNYQNLICPKCKSNKYSKEEN